MSKAQLVETTRDLILDTIKSQIAVKLAGIRVDRNDPIVTTEPPRSYFIFDGAHTYQCPAVFAVVDSMDFPEPSTGANHVNAIVKMYVSVVIEDREADRLTIKSERYQAALFEILHWTTLQDVPKNLRIWTRVVSCQFSPLYTKPRGGSMGEFRKEVSLELEIKHFENPT
jgi:hypothetical protein